MTEIEKSLKEIKNELRLMNGILMDIAKFIKELKE